MKRPTKRPALSQPATIGAVLPAVGKQLHLDDKVREWSVLSLWSRIVDERFAGKTAARGIKRIGGRNILQVAVRGSAVATELGFSLEDYLECYRRYQPQTGLVLHAIELLVTASS